MDLIMYNLLKIKHNKALKRDSQRAAFSLCVDCISF